MARAIRACAHSGGGRRRPRDRLHHRRLRRRPARADADRGGRAGEPVARRARRRGLPTARAALAREMRRRLAVRGARRSTACTRRLVHPARAAARSWQRWSASLRTRLALRVRAPRASLREAQLARLQASLAGLDPQAVLERGYSITYERARRKCCATRPQVTQGERSAHAPRARRAAKRSEEARTPIIGCMAHRLSKITTRTGDAGETGLGDGSRVSKDSARVRALGDIDELNSALGLRARGRAAGRSGARCSTQVQHDLFDLGGELSIPGHALLEPKSRSSAWRPRSSAGTASLPPLKEFILPGGSARRRARRTSRAPCAGAPSAAWSRSASARRWAIPRGATSTGCPTCCSSPAGASTARRARRRAMAPRAQGRR